MDKLCDFSSYSALWFRIFCFLLHVYLTVSNKLKDKITLKEEHSVYSCSLWLMCVYIHKHNTGLMLGKEIWSTVVNYVDLIGILGFFFSLNPTWHHWAKFEFWLHVLWSRSHILAFTTFLSCWWGGWREVSLGGGKQQKPSIYCFGCVTLHLVCQDISSSLLPPMSFWVGSRAYS